MTTQPFDATALAQRLHDMCLFPQNDPSMNPWSWALTQQCLESDEARGDGKLHVRFDVTTSPGDLIVRIEPGAFVSTPRSIGNLNLTDPACLANLELTRRALAVLCNQYM